MTVKDTVPRARTPPAATSIQSAGLRICLWVVSGRTVRREAPPVRGWLATLLTSSWAQPSSSLFRSATASW